MATGSTGAGILVAGGGIVGLSLALELASRGEQVTVLERGAAMGEASTAAAGMLAVEDVDHPAALRELATYSGGMYAEFAERVQRLSGLPLTMQTEATIEYQRDGSRLELHEYSLDPRQLAAALLAAVRRSGVEVRERAEVVSVRACAGGLEVVTAVGETLHAEKLVWATGAWAGPECVRGLVKPMKGQLMRVRLPEPLRGLREVHRRGHVYVAPRLYGPQAGSAIVGATVEDAGFDKQVHEGDLVELRRRAAEMLPELADEVEAPVVEVWAGLRPSTKDGLPLLGESSARGEFYAVGHGRNGILLAPGTAVVMADLLEGKRPQVDVARFAAERFVAAVK